MTTPRVRAATELGATLAAAAGGAFAFAVIGFPAAPLTGAATAVTLAGLAGVPVAIPVWLRTLCFMTLGINIGASVTPGVLRAAAQWPLSFLILSVTLVAAMLVSRTLLERGFGHDRATATLASTPGHLSFVLGLASDTRADLVTVSLVQSTRVLILTLGVPPMIAWAFGQSGESLLPAAVLGPLPGAALYGAAFLVGLGFQRMKLPAAFLLAGMAVSAGAHMTEITVGRLPDGLSIAALAGMGALIGTRFRDVDMASIRAALLAGVSVTAVAVVFAMIGTGAVALLLGLPISLLFVAFAPGGVEAMAAIAVQTGLDPTFVAAHHVFRLTLLTFLVPLLSRDLKRPVGD